MPYRGKSRSRLAALFSLLLLGAPAAAQPAAAYEVRETFEIGHWAGHAQYDEESGDFGLCLVAVDFDNGVTLTFMRKSDGLAFFLSDPRWKLAQYEVYLLTVSVDRLWSKQAEGRVVLNSVVVDLGRDLHAWDALRRGRRLKVVTQAHRFSFVLDGSARALSRLERCFVEHSDAERQAERDPFAGSANPFVAPPPSPPSSQPPSQPPSHGPAPATRPAPNMQRGQLGELLELVTGVEFWVRPAAEVDPSLALEMDYVYGVGELLTGFYWETSAQGYSAERLLTEALAEFQAGCSGPFVSGLRTSVDSTRGWRSHGSHACEADDFFADATVIVWRNGYVSVFVNTTDIADAEVAEEIGAAVGTALAPER